MPTIEPLEPPLPPPLLFVRAMEREGRKRAGVSRDSQAGRLHRIARGVYLEKRETDPVVLHIARSYAAVPGLVPGMVFSHQTAALLHGLTAEEALARTLLQFSRPSSPVSGRTRTTRMIHSTRLAPEDITMVRDVIPVTTVARTVVDCARTLPFVDAVTVADRALRSMHRPEMVRQTMVEAAARLSGCKGVERARRVIAFADPGAANGGESIVRVTLRALDLPAPIVQFRITDPSDPCFEAWTDFGWPDFRTVLEFDGLVKYRPGNPSGLPGHQVLIAEKRREDRLRALGWQVVRITWADLRRPEWIAVQLRRAFARGMEG